MLLVVLRYTIQDGARTPLLNFNGQHRNILHTLYFFPNFSSTLFDDFDLTDGSFPQMLCYL